MKHTLTLIVEDKPGVLDRIASIFSGKGFNIDSIAIGETEFNDISRITIVTTGDDKAIEQIVKQLNKLIDTIKVIDLTEQNRVERELILVTVNYQKSNRNEIKDICEIFRGNIVDINNKTITLEVTGQPQKIDALVNVLSPMGIVELVRSGTVAIKRGEQKNTKQDFLYKN